MDELARAVHTVVHRCLAVQPGEDVVVVTDAPLQEVGEALREEAQRAQAEAVLAVMAPRETHGVEPPRTIAEALAASDVFIVPATRSLSHTQARKRATDRGARGATMPTVTADMLARLMAVDFDLLRQRSHALAGLLDAADEAHVTCPRGTDLRLDLTGRLGLADDGDLTTPGAFGNLPCGEGFISPAGGEGTVATRSTASFGLVQGHPVHLTIEDGRLTGATGADGERLYELLTSAGDGGTNLAELGIGTNDRARLTGNILEDEKMLGTAHVAFGASAGIGGTVSVPIHIDVMVTDATLTIGDVSVLEDGRYVLRGGEAGQVAG
jgi:leucyl aminopeptidase (aminopeptidase T)